MFSVGDKVVCARHGAGTIVAVERKEVLGRLREYLSIRMLHDRLTLVIPVENAGRAGVRKVIAAGDVDGVLEVFRSPSPEVLPQRWHDRSRRIQEKLGTGAIRDVAEVVRDLVQRGDERDLPLGDKRLLQKARRVLVSELAYACDVDEAAATTLLEEALSAARPDPQSLTQDDQRR
jgi:CarD family transcriptional regulator